MNVLCRLVAATTVTLAAFGGCGPQAPSLPPAPASLNVVGNASVRAAGNTPQEIVLHRFNEHSSTDAAGPLTGVIVGAGDALYGTSVFGGTTGNGTVFEVAPTSKGGFRARVLHSFGVGADGAKPGAGLTMDGTGNFLTSTVGGGNFGAGTIVKIYRSGSGYQERVLYNFTGQNNVSQPIGSIVTDGSGAIYGATQFGGSAGFGVVFKLTPSGSNYSESVVYDFPANGTGGIEPQAGLTRDKFGNIYGTTYFGGNMSACNGSGCGVVFKLTPGAQGFIPTILHRFTRTDGANPYGELAIDDRTGKIYGTTYYGGTRCPYGFGCGTVFELSPSGSSYTEKVLWAFADGDDGAYPQGRPLVGTGGVIYGTASWGGEACERSGCGSAFMLTPEATRYHFTILHQFSAGLDGADPEGSGLVVDSSGNLFGTTRSGGGRRCSDGGHGGVRGCGVLYELVAAHIAAR